MEKENILEIKYHNISFLLFALLLLFLGIFLSFGLTPGYGYNEIGFYIGPGLLIAGLVMILFWKRVISVFDRDKNTFSYNVWSIIKKGENVTHNLNEIDKVTYSERLRFQSGGRSRSGTNLDRWTEIRMKDGITYLIYRCQSNRPGGVGMLSKSKSRRVAEKVSQFLNLELEVNSFSPADAIGSVMDRFSGKK